MTFGGDDDDVSCLSLLFRAVPVSKLAGHDHSLVTYAGVTKPRQKPTDAERCQRLPNGTVAKLQAAPHTNCDAARQLPRQTLAWRERSATDVTPSQTLVQELQLRASGSPVCQLQLIVGQR
jgi:hypothetical protein